MDLKKLKELAEKATDIEFHSYHRVEHESKCEGKTSSIIGGTRHGAEKTKTLTSLIERLESAEEALGFYADSGNYGSNDFSRTDGFDCYDIVLFDFNPSDTKKCRRFAGKRARAHFERWGGGE